MTTVSTPISQPDHPGAQLGLPPRGPGSLATLVRRALAAIIDWEGSGWLPEYWEYTQAWKVNYGDTLGWDLVSQSVLEPYPDELQARMAVDSVLVR